MPEHDEHKPPEGNRGVHETEEFVALPELDVNQTVEEDVANVLNGDLRVDEREEETLTLLVVEFKQKTHKPYDQVEEHEPHAHQERYNERMKSGRYAIYHWAWGL